jgi:hypothetical protein
MNRSLLSLAGILACLVALTLWLSGCERVTGEQALNRQLPSKAIEHSIITWTDSAPTACGDLTGGVSGCSHVTFFTDGKTSACTVTLPKKLAGLADRA